MTPSLAIPPDDARLQALLRLGDTCLVLGQRNAEWCGHAPQLEEDIALANLSLDLIGQARALLTLAGAPHGWDEDQLAFLRDERDYRNPTLVELPNRLEATPGRGCFALTVLRNAMVASFLVLMWQRLATASSDAELSAIAAKALKEARYHRRHAADWVARLGDGTEDSRRRLLAALERLWPYAAELFADDAVDEAADAMGLVPRWSALRADWEQDMAAILAEGAVGLPAPGRFLSTGKRGVHSEHMGHLLATMQHLQRAYPGGAW